jgi:hypothetical protein
MSQLMRVGENLSFVSTTSDGLNAIGPIRKTIQGLFFGFFRNVAFQNLAFNISSLQSIEVLSVYEMFFSGMQALTSGITVCIYATGMMCLFFAAVALIGRFFKKDETYIEVLEGLLIDIQNSLEHDPYRQCGIEVIREEIAFTREHPERVIGRQNIKRALFEISEKIRIRGLDRNPTLIKGRGLLESKEGFCTICCDTIPQKEETFSHLSNNNIEHVFHYECMQRWANQQNLMNTPLSCPICRDQLS